MLPALCFIFSRNQVERCAEDITTDLFDEDCSKTPAIVKQECIKMLIKNIWICQIFFVYLIDCIFMYIHI